MFGKFLKHELRLLKKRIARCRRSIRRVIKKRLGKRIEKVKNFFISKKRYLILTALLIIPVLSFLGILSSYLVWLEVSAIVAFFIYRRYLNYCEEHKDEIDDEDEDDAIEAEELDEDEDDAIEAEELDEDDKYFDGFDDFDEDEEDDGDEPAGK